MTGILTPERLAKIAAMDAETWGIHFARSGELPSVYDDRRALLSHITDLDALVRAVLVDAAGSWAALQRMYDAQDKIRKARKPLGSWPRDDFESYVDCLTEDAKAVLAALPAQQEGL